MSFIRSLITMLVAVCVTGLPLRAADITVFAAASLTDVFKHVGDVYQRQTGHTVAFSFAASSALARQIEASSGADIFVSADVDWMDYLDKRGLIDHASRVDLLGNRLVLIAPANTAVTLAIRPRFDLAGALGKGRLSLADPASVPAGKYAKAALTNLGVWDSVSGKIAPAEDVRVALAYVARGEAPLGIVYATDAKMEPRVRIVGSFPDRSSPLIVYPAALTKDAKPQARGFLAFLASPAAAVIFARAGFTPLTK
jgi:molybdate transport system substrate-binding protein